MPVTTMGAAHRLTTYEHSRRGAQQSDVFGRHRETLGMRLHRNSYTELQLAPALISIFVAHPKPVDVSEQCLCVKRRALTRKCVSTW